MQCKVWSVKCGMWSVKCGVERVERVESGECEV